MGGITHFGLRRWREEELAPDDAAVAGRVEGLVAPERLHRERVRSERDVLRVQPRTLVAVLTARCVVPAVLVAQEVVRVGDGLSVLVTGDDRVAVEDAVAERIAGRVDVVHPATRRADAGPVLVQP